MKVLIIGAGEVGQHLARVLSGDNHQIVMVDHNSKVLDWLENSLDIQVVEGHGSSAGVLERSGAWGSDLVLAVTNDDEVNMLAAYFAKVQGAKRTIVRLKGGDYLRFHRHFYKNSLGIDTVLVPNELCSHEIIELVRASQAVAVESFADGQIQMRQVQVPSSSPWVGEKLAKVKMPKQTLVAAIIRDREIMIPSGDSEIHTDDEVLIIGRSDSMGDIAKYGSRRQGRIKLVAIAGGGELGLSVARSLEYSDIKVRLIEEDLGRAEFLSEDLENVTVLHGDATDVTMLKEVGADHADVFISATESDEKNLMISQLAKNLGARRTIAMVKKPSYVDLYSALGVDAVISPRLLVAQQILRYVRRGAIASIAMIGEGKAEVIEIQAREGSKITRGPIYKLGFPRGAIIGSVVRQNKVVIPTGEFNIMPGDSCIIFTFGENLPLIERFFAGKGKKNGIAGALK